MKSIYYFLVGISLLAFGFSGVATSINARLGLVYKENPSPKKQDKPLPKKHKEAKNTSKVTHFSLLTGEITTTDALVLPPSITANNSVAVQGGGSAVPGGQLNYTVVINNAGTDATGVVYTDVLNSNLTLVAGSVTATPIVVDDSYTAVGNVGIVVNAASGLLANDVSPLNLAKTATVVASGTSTNGTYTIAADGSFTYTPNAGFTGSDSFTYTSNIGSVSATGTVNITVSGMIWFVNAAVGTSGNGTLASPFKAISNITGTSAGHTIFLYTGTYTGSLTLLGTQKLIGQGAAASLASITGLTFTNAPTSLPATGGTNPTWNSAALTLGSGNDVQGINFNSTTGTTMTGASVGALKVRDVSLNNTAGQALQITAGGALDAQFKSISASGAAKGISVNSSTGSLQVLGTGTTDGSGGTINNMTTRGVEFISCTNITLNNMNLTSANTADGTNCDATNGNSGCNGAVYLRTVNGATFDNINISGTTSQMGINANNVTALSVKNSNISNCGNNIYEGCMVANSLKGTCDITNSTLSVSAQRVVNVTNLGSETVTLNVTNSTLSDAPEVGLLFEITGTTATGNATLNVKNSNFLRNQSSGVLAQNSGNSTMTFNMDGSTIDPGTGVGLGFGAVSFGNGSGRSTYNFNVGTIAANTIRGRAGTVANVLMQGKADGQGKIQNNLIQKVFTAAGLNAGAYLSAYSQEYSTLKVNITGNQCRPVNTSGAIITDLTTFGGAGGATTQFGMDVGVSIGSTTTVETARTDAYIHNNTVFVNSNFQAINLSAGGSETAASTYINCSQVTNNTTTQQDLDARSFRLRNGQVATSIRLATSGTNGVQDPMEYAWDNNGNTPISTTNTNTVVNSGLGSFTIVPLNTCLTASNPASPNSIAQLLAEEIIENPTEESPVIEEVKTEDTDIKPSTESTSSSARKMAGETILVNGAGAGFSLPAGKSTTIKYSATISSTPTACPIPDQGTVSGSNFTSVQTNLVNTSFTVSPINTVTASSAAICSGGSTSASAVCPVGTVTWYTAASGGSSVATGSPYNPTNITTATSYFAACVVGTCESSRTLVRSVTINANPTASPSSNTPVCVGNTLNLTSTTATSYLWSGPNSFTSTVEDPSVSNVTIPAGGTYTLRVTNSNGCTATATTAVVINTTQAPTAPTATPSSRTTAGSVTLSATGCSGGTLTWFNASTNVAVPAPNNQPNLTSQGTFNFYAKCTGANTCVSDVSVNVSVPVTLCTPLASTPGNVGINWTGLISTDWNNPCNWNPAWVPDATNSAAVINLQTNQPTISSSVPSVGQIYVNSGATLTVSSGGTLNSNSTVAAITLQGGNIINDGNINVSGGGTSVGLSIGANASIMNRGTITTNNLYGAALQFGNLTFTNESTGVFSGDFKANSNILTLTNRGTINYAGGTFALSLGSAGSSVVNTGTISVTAGSGISNPSGSTINNNSCGKIMMTAGNYENGGTTTNTGLIQMPNPFDFTNTGTFTNNGVVKANTVSGITNNRMVITNACPIFTLGGSNNYAVSGIFTDAAATTSAGTYTSVGNKFTANNTIPTGTQTLYAQVTNVPAEGFCTFVVPFDFNNRKPTAVSVNNTTICPSGSVTLSATCASGTPTWYTTATGGSSIGTGASLSNSPTVATTYYVACESTNCASGRVATNGVTISLLPTATANSNSPICAGATLNLTGGAAGNTYSWTSSNGFTSTDQSPSITNATVSTSGTYRITVINASGCTATASVVVAVNALPTATASSNSPICVGNTLNLTGGGVGTYSWTSSNGYTSTAQSPSITNATVSASGTYTITVTNISGCTSTASVSVTVNALPTATASSNSPICSGTTLNLTGGGVGTYAWTSSNGYTSTAQSPIISNATVSATGTYTITVTNASGCTSTASVAVTVNPVPNATVSSNSPICAGTTLNLTGGGVGTYAWTSSNGFTSTAQSPIISNASISESGTYVVTVTNANGCTSTASVAVTVNALPVATASSNSPICAGNTLNLTGGGIGTSYAWTSSNGFTSSAQSPSITNATVSATGTYTITVTNGNNCISTASVVVTVNALPTATASSSTTTICAGNTISLTGGGVGTYSWTSSNGFTSTSQSPTIPNASVSASGTYTITVTNASGCTSTASVAVTVNANPTATASSNSPICVGKTLNLTSGGGGSYSWSGPAINPMNSTTQNPSIPNAISSFNGFYTVMVTNNGCTSTATIAVIVNENPIATASTNTPTICAGNTVSLTGGGVGTYAWTSSNGFTSTDQNPSIANATVSASGTYTITVTNVSGCTSTASVAVTVNANPTATAISNSPICAGTTLNLTGGGVGTYAWTSLNGFTSTAQSPSIANATVSASSTYTITVTNVSGCTSTASVAVTVNSLPVATASSNSPICAGTTLNLTGGGVGTYSWRSSNGYTSTDQNPSIANATVSSSGTYTITVTNASGCTSTASVAVTVNANPTATAGSNSPICAGTTLNLTGGGVGTYSWTSSNGFTSTDQNPSIASATVSASGTYTITVTNVSGCTSTASVAVTVNALPTATASSNSPICAGNTLNLTGGGGVSYAWTSSNGFTSTDQSPSISNATVSASGTYVIAVTNISGCTSTASVAVTVNANPTATASSNSPICAGNTLNLTGGGVGTSYAWVASNGYVSNLQNPTISNASVSESGTYVVTVTNANGCTSTASVAVTVNALPIATASNNSPICSGATLNLTGGGGSSYAWTGVGGFNSTDQNPSITNATISMSGTYMITVTNANGCTSTATTSVTVNPVVSTPIPQANTQIIFGASITLTATGCSGVNDVLKWYQSSNNALVTMPVSPTATTNFYAKCETTLNGITCISGNSTDVTVTVLQPTPPVATGATNCLGTPTTLTATGCSGSVGTFVLKWYQNSDDALVTMPVSPTTTTDYYAKCEQTFNSVTAISAKSNVVTLTILNPPTPVSTGGTIYNGQSISLTATGCSGTLGTFTLKWYQTSDNVEVTMPVSPTVTTQYYSKCEQTANSVTCLSAKSNDVAVTVVNRIFVDISKISAPIQNGNSWATAYGNLQTGLAAATSGVEVWVAKGTYKPTNTITRTIYFNIPNNVKVYGGFAGTEDNLIDRNFRTNVSILSGDIGSEKVASDNSYHVVVMDGSSNATVLDGFTISDGYANFDPNRVYLAPNVLSPSSGTIETGGGILVQNAGMPTIANCTIINNAAVTGGGLYAGDASMPTIMFCKFMANQAGFGSGMYFQDGSNGKVNNTLISGNRGIGGIYNNFSSPVITNTTFAGNGGYNGGIFNSNAQPVIKNSIIWGNSTPFNDTQSIITYSTVQGGYAGIGNLSIDPKYVDQTPEGLSPNTNGDYHLQATSLAIDRGDNGVISLSDKDLDGNLRRFAGGKVDMGTYEFQGIATATLIISAQSGDWEINSTWVGFKVPSLGDYVIIDNNHVVTLNGTGIAKTIEYRGTGQLKLNLATSKLEIGF